jgi:hypothetical protein
MSSKSSPHSLVTRWFTSAPAVLALALAAVACGAADDERPPPPASADYDNAGETTSDVTQDVDSQGNKRARCEEGDARECTIKLPKQGNVNNCIQGVRYCEDGVWGDCEAD